MRELRVLPERGATPGGRRVCGAECGCGNKSHPRHELPPAGREFRPSHLFVEITNRCDLDCIMCERRIDKPNDLMPEAVWDLVLEKFVPSAICTELSGLGEPTLAPLFPAMARGVYKRGGILYVPTNGAAIGRTRILECLQDSQRTRISVSIDAATSESYGRIRVRRDGRPGDWDGMWSQIRRFRSEKSRARLMTGFTAGAYNVDEFPEFVRIAAGEGFDEVAFKPVRLWGMPAEPNSLRFRRERTERALEAAQRIAEDARMVLRAERPPYSDGYENAGDQPGFVSYLDIVPLDVFECTTSTDNTGTTPACWALDQQIPIWGGGTKPAGQIDVGDMLVGLDQDGQKFPARVVKLRHGNEAVVNIRHERGTIRCSMSHPLVVPSLREAISAGNLREGDDLSTLDGKPTRVTGYDIGPAEAVVNWDLEGGAFYHGAAGFDVNMATVGDGSSIDDTLKTGATFPDGPTGPEVGENSTGEPGVYQQPLRPRRFPIAKASYTSDVMGILTDGTVVTCGAKHPIGDVRTDDFDKVSRNQEYQHHLRVRTIDPGLSKWCVGCEKMM